MIAWYLCPMDVRKGPGGIRAVIRECAMLRHVPANITKTAVWDYVEAPGGMALVKLDADDATHAKVAADPEFSVVDDPSQVVLGKSNLVLNETKDGLIDTGDVLPAGKTLADLDAQVAVFSALAAKP